MSDNTQYHALWWNIAGQDTRRWAFYNLGAFMCAQDTGKVHGPDRPEIIAHRYWCPSCDAQPGEPCRLSPRFTQDYSHESRHQGARRAMWRALSRDMDISVGWSIGPRDPWGSDPDRTTRNWRPEEAR